MKITRNPFRRMSRRRKAAVFALAGGLVLTGFVTPPIVQAPRGHETGFLSQAGRTSSDTASDLEKTKIRLSAEKARNDREQAPIPPADDLRTPEKTERTDYRVAESETAQSRPVYSTSVTQQQSSQLKETDQEGKKETEPADNEPAPAPGQPVEEDPAAPDDGSGNPPQEPGTEPPAEEPDPPDNPDQPNPPGEEEPGQPPQDGDEPDEGEDGNNGDGGEDSDGQNGLRDIIGGILRP